MENNNFDYSKLRVTTDNRVQIGNGQFIAKDSLSPLGYQMALNYKQNEDGGTPAPGTAQGTVTPPGTTDVSGTAVGANTGTNTNGANAKNPSSSASVILDSNANKSVSSAASSDKPTPAQQRIMDYYGIGFDSVKGMDELTAAREFKALNDSDSAKKEAEAQKNQEMAALAQRTASQNASQDAQYRTTYNELEKQRQQSLTSMTTKAFAANPFAANSTAMSGYTDAINLKYDQAVMSLNDKYNSAKQAIASGDTDSYTKIMADSRTFVNNLNKDLTGQMNTVTDDIRQQKQFELSLSKADQGNFLTMIKTFSGSPDLQKEVESYSQTGKASAGLQEILDRGAKAGLTTDETTSILKYQTDQERATAFRQDMQTQRLIMSQERLAQAQREQNTRSNVAATAQNLTNQGISPDSPQYAFNLGYASTGGKQLPVAEVDKFTQLIQLTKQLGDLKTGLQTIDKDKDIKNIILGHTGDSVQSLTSKDLAILTAKINAMAAPIARSIYGEKGNLSEGDVERVLSSMPNGTKTADVRDALYNGLVKLVSDSTTSNIQSLASGGYDVSGYVPYAAHLDSTYKNNQIGTSYTAQYNGKTYTFPDLKSLDGFKKELNLK